MSMRIVITGTPGTGKSAVAKALSRKLSTDLVDIKRIVERTMRLGREREVDLRQLSSALRFLRRKRDFVAEGHLACEVRLPADRIFVLRTRPDILRRRLSKRGYNRKKLEENLMAEMLDYCTQRVRKVYGRTPLELDTARRSASASADAILSAIRHKNKKLDSVDYSAYLRKQVLAGGSR